MIRKHTVIFGCIALVFGCVTSEAAVYIGADGRSLLTAEELDMEEASLNKMNRKADEVRDSYGQYTVVRDEYYYGTSGTIAVANSWFTKSAAWLPKVDGIIADLGADKVALLIDPVARDALRSKLSTMVTELRALIKDAGALQLRANKGRQVLGEVRRWPNNYIPGGEQMIALVNGKMDELDVALSNIDSSVNGTLTDVLNILSSKTKEVTDILITRESYKFPDLVTALQNVQLLLDSERLLAPVKDEVSRFGADILSLKNNKRPFAAKQKYGDMTVRVEQLKLDVNAMNADSALKTQTIDYINSVYGTAGNNASIAYRDRASTIYYSYKAFVYDPVTPGAEYLAKACPSDTLRKRYNCQLGREISGLNSATILAMDDASLKYIEDTIQKIKEGPL